MLALKNTKSNYHIYNTQISLNYLFFISPFFSYSDLHKYWFAAKTCFLSWEKHEEASTSTWVLLLPVEHLHTKVRILYTSYNFLTQIEKWILLLLLIQWDTVILEEIRSTYEEVLPYDADRFIKTLCDDLTEFVSESENLPISLLISIIDLCKIVLQSPKRSG